MHFVLTRTQAYEFAWSRPMKDLAEMARVSDVALAKCLRGAKIPVPPQGYWNKLSAGHRVERLALPPADLGTARYVRVSGQLSSEVRQLIKGEPGEETEGAFEHIDLLEERFRSRIGKLRVADLTEQHRETKRALENARRINERNSSSGWQDTLLKGPAEARRLKFINALLLGAERFGNGAHLRVSHDHIETTLHFGGFASTCDVVYRDPGKKTLSVSIQRHGFGHDGDEWKDTKERKVEESYIDILVEMAKFGIVAQRQIEEQDLARKKRETEENAVRAAEEAVEAKAKARHEEDEVLARQIRRLLDAAENMRRANLIRDFVKSVTDRPNFHTIPGAEVWSCFAMEQADAIDPMQNGELTSQIADMSPPSSERLPTQDE